MRDVVEKCIDGIGKLGLLAAKEGDEIGVKKACNALVNIIGKPYQEDPPEDIVFDWSPKEVNDKIDHIMSWLKPLIARLEKKNG